MSAAVTVPVGYCAECPFVDGHEEPWLCFAGNDARAIGPRQPPGGGMWLPPPTWCPLRTADRLVTLRVR